MPNWGGHCQPHLNTDKIRYLVLASGTCMEVIYSPEGLACGNPLCILPLCSYQYLSRYSRVRWPHKPYTEDGSLCDLRLADVYMFQRISGVGGKMSPWKIRKQMLNQNHDPCLHVHALWTCRRLTRTQMWKKKTYRQVKLLTVGAKRAFGTRRAHSFTVLSPNRAPRWSQPFPVVCEKLLSRCELLCARI